MVDLYTYPERYAIASLDLNAEIGSVPQYGFYTCIRDNNEITLVMLEELIPINTCKVARGYRIVMLNTEFPFDVIGVLAKCSTALAEAGIPIMAYSSYKTDIFMFQEEHFVRACKILHEQYI